MDIKIEFLPKSVRDPIFEQRESGRAHTPYEEEIRFYRLIKDGNVEAVKAAISLFLDKVLIVGRMSNDNLRQAQYFAVSCITLAVRYAIEGGLSQSVAYNLSDKYIMQVDAFTKQEDIFAFLTEKAVELASMVESSRQRLQYPPHVRKAIRYVDSHLHERITGSQVAEECGVSSDYLSLQLKKYVGYGLSRYILTTKLEEAKKLLLESEYSCGEIAYILGFCSETHFITCFKRENGLTPKQFIKQNTI